MYSRCLIYLLVATVYNYKQATVGYTCFDEGLRTEGS